MKLIADDRAAALERALGEAREAAYDGVSCIEFEGAQHRTDIAAKAAAGEV